nr:alpha/beta fold hydrolase [Pseudomonas sp. PDM14]
MSALASLHSHDIPTCLGRLRVRDSGGTGMPMLFWSSLLMSGGMWQAQAEHFAGRYRVLLIDPPGHGDSEALQRHFAFDECARCLVEVLDHLGLAQGHFVGNSWGGMIGATFAARYPGRLGVAVLMNATASPAGWKHRLEFPLLAVLARLLGLDGVLKRLVVGNFVGPDQRSAAAPGAGQHRRCAGALPAGLGGLGGEQRGAAPPGSARAASRHPPAGAGHRRRGRPGVPGRGNPRHGRGDPRRRIRGDAMHRAPGRTGKPAGSERTDRRLSRPPCRGGGRTQD